MSRVLALTGLGVVVGVLLLAVGYFLIPPLALWFMFGWLAL